MRQARFRPTHFVLCILLTGGVVIAQQADPHKTAGAWSYAGSNGPDHWATLAPGYSVCGTGMRQSPIDVDAARMAVAASRVETSYPGAFVSAVNNGHALEFTADRGNRMTIGNDSYELLQLHLHAPSEHTIDGTAFPLEAHFVHRNADGALAVLGLLFREGADDEGVAALLAAQPGAAGAHVPADISLAGLWRPSRYAFVSYDGSLTTPPCTEGVRWFVSDTGLTVSPAQIARFHTAVGANARPVQPAHGRKVGR